MPFIVIFSKDQSKLAGVDLVVDLVFFSFCPYCIVIVSISSLSLHEGCIVFCTAKFPFSFKRNQGIS